MTNIVKNIETKSKLEDECRLHPIHAKAMNRFYAPIYKTKNYERIRKVH